MRKKENNGIRFNEAATIFAIRHTMTNSSSCSNNSSILVATHRAAAAAAALCMRKHMPGIYVVQIDVSAPRGARLLNHSRCQTKKEANKKAHQKNREKARGGIEPGNL